MSAFARRLERGGTLTDLLMVSAIAALVLLPALGQTRYLANRELRHAEISREMAETHDQILSFSTRSATPVMLLRFRASPSETSAR